MVALQYSRIGLVLQVGCGRIAMTTCQGTMLLPALLAVFLLLVIPPSPSLAETGRVQTRSNSLCRCPSNRPLVCLLVTTGPFCLLHLLVVYILDCICFFTVQPRSTVSGTPGLLREEEYMPFWSGVARALVLHSPLDKTEYNASDASV